MVMKKHEQKHHAVYILSTVHIYCTEYMLDTLYLIYVDTYPTNTQIHNTAQPQIHSCWLFVTRLFQAGKS